MIKRLMLGTLVVTMLLSACKNISDNVNSQQDTLPPVTADDEVEDPDTQTNSIVDEEKPVQQLTSRAAYRAVLEKLGDGDYIVMEAQTGLLIENEPYFVFIVAFADGKPLGQVAINKITSEQYYYQGEGEISDYSKLTDRISPANPSDVEKEWLDWSGTYTDGAHILTIIHETEQSFTYEIDGVQGEAQVTELTAVCEENEQAFSYSNQEDEQVSVLLSGQKEGTFILQPIQGVEDTDDAD